MFGVKKKVGSALLQGLENQLRGTPYPLEEEARGKKQEEETEKS